MNIRKIKKLLKTVRVCSTYDGLRLEIPAFWAIIYFGFDDLILKTCSIDLLKFIIMNKDYESAYIILTHKKSRHNLTKLFYNKNNMLLLQLLEEVITVNRDFLMSYINYCKRIEFKFYSEKLNKLGLFL